MKQLAQTLALWAGFLLLGIVIGWVSRGPVIQKVTVYQPVTAPASAPLVVKEPEKKAEPKPTEEKPKDPAAPLPVMPPLVGEVQGPLPSLPMTSPAAPVSNSDLNADEALLRRLCIEGGAVLIQAQDVRGEYGLIGRSLTAEGGPEQMERLRQKASNQLKERLVISDAGLVTKDAEEVRRAQNDLDSVRKKRDQARIDFTEASPILKQLEEDTLAAEDRLEAARKANSKRRLTLLLRASG